MRNKQKHESRTLSQTQRQAAIEQSMPKLPVRGPTRAGLNTGGRPRKFAAASRPITVTLPETTLAGLVLIHPDRARAIVKATETATSGMTNHSHIIEVVEIEKNTGIIVVGPSKSLKRIPWLRMVSVAPARYLLIIPPGMLVDSLEIAILDLLDHLPPEDADEREMLGKLRDLIRNLRRGQSVSKAEILIVNTKPANQRR